MDSEERQREYQRRRRASREKKRRLWEAIELLGSKPKGEAFTHEELAFLECTGTRIGQLRGYRSYKKSKEQKQ